MAHHQPPAQQRPSSSSRVHHAASAKRFHPYMAPQQRCRYPDISASPSPPPAMAVVRPAIAPASEHTDYLSALPQELIEEIGLLTCVAPYTGDPTQPFHAERHRLRSFHALALVSKQFHQIFAHRLYLQPLVFDTQEARSVHLPNTAPLWLNPYRHDKAALAREFTLWRPWSEEIKSGHLNSVDPFLILFQLTNIHELTFSGNFAMNTPKAPTHWTPTTLTVKNVPHLTSVRLIGVDNSELINSLLTGIAPNIKTLVIHPTADDTEKMHNYNPRTVYANLRSTFEGLATLESLTVSLPSVKVNHCNHGNKLVQKTLQCIPKKETLKHVAITLPVFGCRSVQWLDVSDTEDEPEMPVNHAWFWLTLQNFLAALTNLSKFVFTGSAPPAEMRRKIIAASPNADISFVKGEFKTSCTRRLYSIPTFPYNLDVPAQTHPQPPQPETPSTPFPAAVETPISATPFFATEDAWRALPDPFPQLPRIESTAGPWVHPPSYERTPVPLQVDSSPLNLPSFSVFNLLTIPHPGPSYPDPSHEPTPPPQQWHEDPPSQPISMDSGFASQEYPVDASPASFSQNPLMETEEWAPASGWDSYIQYD